MGLLFVFLAAHGFRASSIARGSDFGKCQTFAASPAEPGELPLWFRVLSSTVQLEQPPRYAGCDSKCCGVCWRFDHNGGLANGGGGETQRCGIFGNSSGAPWSAGSIGLDRACCNERGGKSQGGRRR